MKYSKAMHVLILSLSMVIVSEVSFAEAKTCYTCNPDYVPGNPVDGNKTLGQLAEISLVQLSDIDGNFMGDLYGFCIEFPGDIKGARTLRKRVISEMEKLPVNGTVDPYFIEAGCNPEEIGRTRSPIAHIAAELPSVRMDHLEVVRKYFIEIKKDGLFAKMINAKNTKGHTTLDYVQYMIEERKYIESQKIMIKTFISYLCSHGGTYSVYSNKSCV